MPSQYNKQTWLSWRSRLLDNLNSKAECGKFKEKYKCIFLVIKISNFYILVKNMNCINTKRGSCDFYTDITAGVRQMLDQRQCEEMGIKPFQMFFLWLSTEKSHSGTKSLLQLTQSTFTHVTLLYSSRPNKDIIVKPLSTVQESFYLWAASTVCSQSWRLSSSFIFLTKAGKNPGKPTMTWLTTSSAPE